MRSILFDTKFIILDKILNKLFIRYREKKYFSHFYKTTYPPTTKGNILIYAGIGHMYLTPSEILLSHLFKRKGYQVEYSIYDKDVLLNEIITKSVVERSGKEKFWNKTVNRAKLLLTSSNVTFEYIKPEDIVFSTLNQSGETLEELFAFKLEGIDFGDIVKGVMYRYYKSLSFGDDAFDVAKKFMQTALTNYFYIKKKCESQKYEYILFSHGIYCTWQPVVEYCQQIGQNYICYDRAKTKNHININLNKPSPVWDISEAWKRLISYSLTKEEHQKVESYLADRELQKGDVYAYNFQQKEKDLNALRKKLGIKPGAKVITIFTNLIWDAANVSRDIAFSSPLDCIVKTIKRFENDEHVHILVRPHPAEVVLGTQERYDKLVLNAFKHNLPSNVSIISHDLKVNSFSVLEISDIGVIHTSTVGLELAIEGKATILISETHYRDKGFTYDAQNENHYFDIINSVLNDGNKLPQQVELAKKYFYLMMFEYQHEMPVEFTPSGHFNGYTYDNVEDLIQSEKEDVNQIVEYVDKGGFEDFIFR